MNLRTNGIAIIALIATATLSAQTPSSVPVPSQIATAKTAFLGSGGAPAGVTEEKQVVAALYPSLYRALASANLYQMTSTPAQAELSMVVSLDTFISGAATGSSLEYDFIRLAVFDTKTHALLWIIDEPIDGQFRKKSYLKNMDNTTARVVADLKQLASGTISSNSAAIASTKSRMSQEK